MMVSEDNIKGILLERGALQEGHFLLASGKHSEYYIQTAQLMKDPVLVERLLRNFFDKTDSFGSVDTVLTAAKGGITVAQQVGLTLGEKAIFAERSDDDALILKRGFEIIPDDPVLLVEDVVTTGGTLSELQSLAENHGADIQGAFVLVNRSGKNTINNLKLYSLVDLEFPVYEADQCPRCQQGDDAVRPGTKQAKSN